MGNQIELPNKTCVKCNKSKPVDQFSTKGSIKARYSWCRLCFNTYLRARYKKKDNEAHIMWKKEHGL